MPELRYDPFRGKWTIIAADRGARPSSFARRQEHDGDNGVCPLCPGNEAMTPPEIYAVRGDGSLPDTPGWSIRVVPNKYPALSLSAAPEVVEPGLYAAAGAFGSHEVIVETTSHELQMADLSPEQISEVLRVYRRRVNDLFGDQRIDTVLLFKNYGAAAGASLIHAHTQLAALPFTPVDIRSETEAFARYGEVAGGCLMCRVLEEEASRGRRIVDAGRGFVVFAPFASRFPYETWIVPEEHAPCFTTITDDGCLQLAHVLRSLLYRLREEVQDPPYNLVLHTAPAGVEGFHWHLELGPRLTTLGGFELGTGVMINTVAPETAAAILRNS